METSPTTTTLTAKDPIAGIQTGMLFSGFMKCFSNASKIQAISATTLKSLWISEAEVHNKAALILQYKFQETEKRQVPEQTNGKESSFRHKMFRKRIPE